MNQNIVERSQLIKILRDTFPGAVFDENDQDLGLGSFEEWDSLGNFNLLLQVEDYAGIRFDADEISEIKTLAALLEALRRHQADGN